MRSLRFNQHRRRETVRRQWPSSLLFLAGAMRAGLSAEQALETLATDGPRPLSDLLRERLSALRSSSSLERRVTVVFDDPSLRLARAALLLTRKTGGQAARVLETCAALLQQSIEMEDRVEALAAQSKASAWIVGLAPFAISAALAVVAPDYMEPLLSTRTGWLVMALSVILVACGLMLVRAMARLDT